MTSGENNPRAELSDAEVDHIRDLYEEDRGKPRAERYWTAPRLAEKFEVSLRHIWYIISGERRAGGIEE